MTRLCVLLFVLAGSLCGQGGDPYEDGMKAYRNRNFKKAVELLSKVPRTHRNYALAMRYIGYNIYVREWNQPKKGIPFLDKAFKAAPYDHKVIEDITRGYAKAGLTFDPKRAGRPEVPVASRKHAKAVRKEFGFLVTPISPDHPWSRKEISREQAQEDLGHLEYLLTERYSYLKGKRVDYEGALDAIRLKLGEDTPRGVLAQRLAKLLTLFGDGHTRLELSPSRYLPSGYAPYLVDEYAGRLYAFRADRSDFLDRKHPCLSAIGGVAIKKWLEAAGQLACKGSRQLFRRDQIRNLRFLGWLRGELGLKGGNTIELTLASADGRRQRQLEVSLARRRAIYGDWPKTRSRILDGDIGYLRIPTMALRRSELEELERRMQAFADTKGLILDVRGNGGGSREALRVLMPYFVRRGDPPRIVNAAVYRKPTKTPPSAEGYLADCFLWPLASDRWSLKEKNSIISFAKTFHHEWKPLQSSFSGWHYMIVDASTNPKARFYNKPVVVLMDSRCFSATDVFLGAFKGLPNVTLVGTASGGGSGRSKRHVLPNSGIPLKLSTMASFQPNGRLYDGNGVQPDIVRKAKPTDWLGRTDSVLDFALARLR